MNELLGVKGSCLSVKWNFLIRDDEKVAVSMRNRFFYLPPYRTEGFRVFSHGPSFPFTADVSRFFVDCNVNTRNPTHANERHEGRI